MLICLLAALGYICIATANGASLLRLLLYEKREQIAVFKSSLYVQ